MYKKYGLLTKGLPATKLRKKLTDLQVWEATDTMTIESLFIIQKTHPKPSDNKPSDYQHQQLALSTKLQPQQLFQLPIQQQQPHLDPMAYAPIAKLNQFTGEEDNAKVWLNDVEKAITANRWNNARTLQAIPYFLRDTTDA
ncbi:hypothetical protein G9A89_008346 [Geosiphon pyriformis]|nr:hypothetical protein G9A89_008346 [Geosiphon pyriformis]